ncbi:membrane protein [Streptococcus agalactiae LMG 15089]|nr:membrane protein [Streptococcus agalactiae LMG 15089]
MNRIINRDILPRISKISKNNKEKDLLSIAYITWLIFIIFALGVVTVNDLKPMFNQLIVNLLNIYYYMEAFILGMDSYLQYNLPYSFDFWSIFVEAINLFVKVFLIAFIPSVIRKVLKKESFFNEVVILLGAIVTIIVSFHLYLEILIVVGLILLLIAFVSIGKNRVYNFVQNLNYFEEVIWNYFEENPVKIKEKSLIIKFLLTISFVFVIDFAMVRLLNFNIKFSTILACSAILLAWLYQNKSVTEPFLLKKLVIYFIFFIATLIGNLKNELSILETPLLFISIFFTMDRIIALSKEMRDLIISKSILFYYDHENIKPSILLSEIKEIKYLENVDIGELELVRQMVIRLRLELEEEFLILSDIYMKNGYEKYIQFVQGNVYFINLELDKIPNYTNLKLILESIFDHNNQKIFIPKLYEEYIYILISLGEVEKAKEILDFLRNKIWYNSSMNYEASKQLTDVRFKRLVGVQRTTFEEMLAVLKTAYQRKHAKGGRTPKLSLEDLLMATLQYMREYRTYEQIAADFGIHESNLIRRSQWVESTLIQSGFTISKTHLSAEDTVIVDATEVKINRPKKIN